MNISPSKAKRLALSLRRENRKNKRSWRTIAREDYQDRIDQSTLSRIARERGRWIPASEDLRLLLGLIKPRRPQPKPISEMSVTELLQALKDREPMPPITYSQRTMDKFISACRQASKQRARAS